MKKFGEDFKETLSGAIYREIGARNFYKRVSDAIKNAEGKERFKRLSQDEEGHRAALESWHKKLFNETFVPDPELVKEAEIDGIAINEKAGAMEALDLAIGAEAKAEAFYAAQAEAIEVPELRDLMRRLAAMEHGHWEILSAERNSLIGGFYWFDMDSSSFLED